MTMIGRVARALLDALKAQNGGSALARGEIDDALLDGQFDLGPVARAAIEALRKPTEKMLDEGAYGSGEDTHAAARGAWEAMIDAALADGKANERPTDPRTA